ncbi:MAG: biotin transporter BioY [Clostridiales bacterium]|nr:biotin transporter BioY [Clostridiales bacterium]
MQQGTEPLSEAGRTGATAALPGPAAIPGRTRELVTAALLAALLAASAWVAIPLGGGVPLTLQVFIVVLAGLVLGPRAAGIALAVYLLLGAAGVPVFAGARGGLDVLFGPTGGYLWGFLVAAVLISFLRSGLALAVTSRFAEAVAVAVGVIAIYLLGWTQLMLVMALDPAAAFVAGVLPFIVADAIKGAVAIGVAAALRRARVVV